MISNSFSVFTGVCFARNEHYLAAFLQNLLKQPYGMCLEALVCGRPQTKDKQHVQKKDLTWLVFFLTDPSLKNRRRRFFSVNSLGVLTVMKKAVVSGLKGARSWR